MINERLEPTVLEWLDDGGDSVPRDGVKNVLAAAATVGQRPAWAFPQRWLPGGMVGLDGRPTLAGQLGILVAVALLALLAVTAAYVGSQRHQLPLRPTGDVIAFRHGDQIAVANTDGTQEAVVSGNVAFARSPVFSPDGIRIAFVSPATAADLSGSLMVVPFDGSRQPMDVGHGLVLTPSQTTEFSWSPTSQQLVFSASQDGATKLFVANADGSAAPQPITDGSAAADLPDWNPNTDLIAYRSRDPDGTHTNIVQIAINGSEPLTKAGVVAADAFISRPRWRPNDDHVDDAGVPAWVLAYSINAGFGTNTSAAIDPGMGTIDALPLTSPVSDWEGGLPWSPDGSQVAVLTEGGVTLAAFDEGFNAISHPYDGPSLDLGNVIDCWVEWSPDDTSLYGGSPGSCDHIVRVPIASPASAVRLPMNITGTASWRPRPQNSQATETPQSPGPTP